VVKIYLFSGTNSWLLPQNFYTNHSVPIKIEESKLLLCLMITQYLSVFKSDLSNFFQNIFCFIGYFSIKLKFLYSRIFLMKPTYLIITTIIIQLFKYFHNYYPIIWLLHSSNSPQASFNFNILDLCTRNHGVKRLKIILN